MLVKVEKNEILNFLRSSKDCKLEVDVKGDYFIRPQATMPFLDTIFVKLFNASDYQDFVREQDFLNRMEKDLCGVYDISSSVELKIDLV